MTQAKTLRSSLFFTILLLFATLSSVGSSEGGNDEKSEKKEEKPALTLEPTRKVEFNTDEGTWLSLDVSPDGKTVVFDLLGDLYSVSIEGGATTRISDGMAFDSQPSFSPNGEWIAYISDKGGSDNLWICKPDGSDAKALTKGKQESFLSPTWTPDSQYVLVGKGNRSIDLWMYHVDGGSGVAVGSGAKEDSGGSSSSRTLRLGPTVSPDGRFLYFSKRSAKSVYNQMTFDWDIFRRDMVTGDEDRVTQADFGAFRPVLSPDGKQLVYGTRFDAETGLRIRDLDSGQDRWLKFPVQRDDMESLGSQDLFPGYSFTPDGRELVVTDGGGIVRINIESGRETKVPFLVEVKQDIGALLNFQRKVDEGPVRSRLIRFPIQSPDGRFIVFSAMAKLYIMELPSGKPRRLTQSEAWEFKPAWSPDGRWVVFVTWNYQGEGHIWRAPLDGSTSPQQLTTTPAFYTDPAVSKDGKRIVARRGNAWMRSQSPSEFGGLKISLDLVWIGAEGGDVSLIVPARGLGSPHFGPESDRIYFNSSEGLVSLRYDGTDRRTHLKVAGKKRPGAEKPSPAEEILLSPAGGWALAKVSDQMYLVAVPPVGGDGADVNVFSPEVPVKRLTSIGADSFAWADGGNTISWGVGSTYFRRPLSSVSFKAEEKGKGSDSDKESNSSENEGDATGDVEGGEGAAESDRPSERVALEDQDSVESFEAVIEYPRQKPEGIVVLRGATTITMNGDEVIRDADIVVRDNRIKNIGPRGTAAIPKDARIFDVTGKFVVPGFVDTHAHYEMRTEGVLELHNWSFAANLAYGVTTGLDVQTSTNDYLTYQDLVEAGMMIGPRAYSTGPGVFSSTDFQSADEAYWVLKKYKEHYRNNNLKSYMVGNRQQRQWVATAARQLELTVTTEGGLDLKLDLSHALDGFGGNEHALPIVPLRKDVIQLFAQAQIAYTPTLLVLYGGPFAENVFYQATDVHSDQKLNRFIPHNDLDLKSRRLPWFHPEEHAYPKMAAGSGEVQRAGGRVGIGGHGQLQGLGYHWEMWALAEGGLTPYEVLKAATVDGAYIVGLGQDLGSLEPGKLADLIVLERNPLEDIRNTNSIRFVMKNGEVFEGDTLNQVWPGQKELPPFWWWSGAPFKSR